MDLIQILIRIDYGKIIRQLGNFKTDQTLDDINELEFILKVW